MHGEPQSLTLTATPDSLALALDFIRKGAQAANLPELRIGELELLVEEVLMNVALHAYPSDAPGIVTVSYAIPAEGELAVEISDRGMEFNPLLASPPDLTLNLEQRPIGGLGILLLRSFANSLTYRREQGWNRLLFAVSANR